MATRKKSAATKDKPVDLLRRMSPPMLASLATSLPGDLSQYALEIKYDGFRALAAIVDGEVAIWSRNALDLGDRFPHIVTALKKLKGAAVIDGEIVALDEKGIPRFQLLQRGGTAADVFFVFDLLWADGVDFRSEPLETRREALEQFLKRAPKTIQPSERVSGEPVEALATAARTGHEGLIAKVRGSKYENRRSKAWLKLKAVNAQELAIVGFTPSTHSSREIGALLLAVAGKGKYRFAGKVGTGFSAKLRVDLKQRLERDRVERPVPEDAPRMRGATWVEPRLVAQVRFTEWTSDGKLRHPSFLGLRDDKSAEEAEMERPIKKKKAGAAPKKEKPVGPVVLTNPDRLMYPRDGITKQDVADYYEAVSKPMMHALADRPLALEHWNQGIDSPSWFHQNVASNAPTWLTTIETPARTTGKSVNHLVVDRPDTLRWLAQRSVLTMHMWSSRGASLDNPDWVVFDLDPAKGKGIEQAIDTALVLRRLFEEMELFSMPKTSGKRGIHLFVPIGSGYTHEETAEFAYTLADRVASKLSWATIERPIAKRRGRLYLDCLQNGYGKTVVAPYALRAMDGAPVSAPLEWSEVNAKLDPKKFNLRSMPNRLAKKGDLFAAVFKTKNKLPKLK